jgi:predicted dithiol-disulfide oxidoreductase (DUF899 family)
LGHRHRATIMPASNTPISTHPKVVSREEWQQAREMLLAREKKHTREQDALATERRRLPMFLIEKEYAFEGPEGKVSLLDLFNGRKQLIIYHFMYHEEDDSFCNGCSMMVDNMGHPAHLNARDASRVLVAKAPLKRILEHKERMGWQEPWYSSLGSDFNSDFGVTTEDGEMFGLSVMLQEEGKIYQTYFTDGRGVEQLGSSFSYLDLLPYGRMEEWEDSPEGCPQGPLYQWWKMHDEYEL